jgi:hypothetical protein
MKEAEHYWQSIWEVEAQHNEKAKWIRREKKRRRRNQKHGVDTYKRNTIYLSFGKNVQLEVPRK